MSIDADQWKRAWDGTESTLPDGYDYWHGIWIPERERMLDVFLSLKNEFQPTADKVLDIGGGTGAVTLHLLKESTNIQATLLDGSRKQLETAKERFLEDGHSCNLIYKDLNQEDWFASLERDYPLIVSNIAIHHLSDERKKKVFADTLGLLRPSGLFIYGDLISFEDQEREDQAYDLWNYEIRKKFVEKGLPLKPLDWMKRKLIEAGQKEGDQPASIERIMKDLQDVGFISVSLVWFYIKFAVIMGVKAPTGRAVS